MKKSFEELLKSLNKEQLLAVESIEGPVMVLAGPGTGKTQILALRIANILKKQDVDPRGILALTFTENGVLAMRERLASIIGSVAYDVQICTFHSFCMMVIEEFPEKFTDNKELSLIDDVGKYELVKEILDKYSFQHLIQFQNKYAKTRTILQAVSNCKKENLDLQDLHSYLLKRFEELNQALQEEGLLKGKKAALLKDKKALMEFEEFLRFYKIYSELVRERGYYDFDDMLSFVVKKFKSDQELLLNYQERFLYVLADEFQDTNGIQMELMNSLVSYYEESPNIFVVGDDDQSIYRFQGASVKNFNDFLERYPRAKSISLVQNYRSTQLILDAAKSCIAMNNDRVNKDKILKANLEHSDSKLFFSKFNTAIEEGSFMVDKLKELLGRGVTAGEIAVLVRKNSDVSEVAELLKRNEIPYVASYNQNIFLNRFVVLILSLLNVIVDDGALLDLAKVLFLPKFGLSVSEIGALMAKFRRVKSPTLLALRESHKLTEKEEALLQFFEKFILKFQREPLYMVLLDLLEEIEMIDYMQNYSTNLIEDMSALNTFLYFVSNQIRFSTLELAALLTKIETILSHNLELTSYNFDSRTDGVNIMTVHKSKGLEFEYVFMAKLNENDWNKSGRTDSLIPQDFLTQIYENELDQIAESRRLFYVGLTRAKYGVYLSFAEHSGTRKKVDVCRFVLDIETDLVTEIEVEPLKAVEVMNALTVKASEGFLKESERQALKLELAENFVLSPTAMNDYLTCKKKFFAKYILKIQEKPNMTLSLGILVHKFLELSLKTKSYNLEYFKKVADDILAKTWFSETEALLVKEKALKMFQEWFDFNKKQNSLPDVWLAESYLTLDDPVGKTKISGKIDLIEKSLTDKKCVVTDFKTGQVKTENEILGQTQSSDGSIYRQLLFYKMLVEARYRVPVDLGKIVFITPKENGDFISRQIVLKSDDFEEFKKQVHSVYHEILDLKFLDFEESCDCRHGCSYGFL